jgi:hypothetical protein
LETVADPMAGCDSGNRSSDEQPSQISIDAACCHRVAR